MGALIDATNRRAGNVTPSAQTQSVGGAFGEGIGVGTTNLLVAPMRPLAIVGDVWERVERAEWKGVFIELFQTSLAMGPIGPMLQAHRQAEDFALLFQGDIHAADRLSEDSAAMAWSAAGVLGVLPKTTPRPKIDWERFVYESQRPPNILNLGGEGEMATAWNINDESLLLKGPKWDPAWGPLVKAKYERLPNRSGCIDEIVGNRLPGQADPILQTMTNEAYRTLKPGGRIRLWSTSAPGEFWVDYLKKAGFIDVRVERGAAIGTKPL